MHHGYIHHGNMYQRFMHHRAIEVEREVLVNFAKVFFSLSLYFNLHISLARDLDQDTTSRVDDYNPFL